MTRWTTSKWATLILLWAACAVFALPLVMMVSGSLKTATQLTSDPYSILPGEVAVSNYSEAVTAMPFWKYLTNTVILCVGCVFGTTCSCALIAYGLSRVPWAGKRVLFGLVVVTMLLPWHITMIPRFVLISELGLYNSFWAIIGPTFLGDAFFIFLLRQFFLSIPQSVLDAGRLDGLGHWGLFSYLIVPLSKPALITVALFQFVQTWNDFSGPLLYLNDPQKFPLAYGLERFVSSYGDQTHLLLAAAVLFTLPMVILFFVAQKTFIEGISTT